MSTVDFEARARDWTRQNRLRLLGKASERATSKPSLPPEHLRKIMKDHGDMRSAKYRYEKRAYLGAMKYLPHAIMKLFETMPMPWEAVRYVDVAYHTSGALTLVTENPRVVPAVYLAQWGSVYLAMRREKRDRKHFRRMRFPVFDDEENFIDYGDNLDGVEPLDPVQLDLDADEHSEILWLYEDEAKQKKTFRLSAQQLASLYKLASPLVLPANVDAFDTDGNTRRYLFDLSALISAKAMHVALPGQPRFEPLHPTEPDEDWTEFNDVTKLIARQPLKPETRLAFPFLYNSNTDDVQLAPYANVLPIFQEDAQADKDAAPFRFTENLTMVPPRHPDVVLAEDLLQQELGDWLAVCREAKPALAALELERPVPDGTGVNVNVAAALDLLNAPQTFRTRTGRTVRAVEMDVVRDWPKERPGKEAPAKVKAATARLLKRKVYRAVRRRSRVKPRKSRKLWQLFLKTKYFQKTELDWVEAGLQVCRQGWNVLNLLIHRRNLNNILVLDKNFNLKPTKTMTTKERKKSRLGHSFHILRELLKLTKLCVDAHVQFRMNNVDAFQLNDGLQYLFSHVGQLTGLYRYKYRIMRQVKECKDLKHLVYDRFNAGPVGKGPGVGFWLPQWRVWCHLLRGLAPTLEEWLGNLLGRVFEGRKGRENLYKSVTKQRVESHFDLELRAEVTKEILDLMPTNLRASKAKVVLSHLTEAWRCWKAGIAWAVPGMPPQVDALIRKFVKRKGDWWTQGAYMGRAQISKGDVVDKTVAKKNLGRLARLAMKDELTRQDEYLQTGPYLSTSEAVKVYQVMVQWFQSSSSIPFPPANYKHDTKILTLALERLKEQYSVQARLNQSQKEELALIEQAFDNPQETLARIKRHLLTMRAFKEVSVEFFDHYTHISPVFAVNAMEKLTDAYLDQYLMFEADLRGVFPSWVKPRDAEPEPVAVYRWCEQINNLPNVWESTSLVHVETDLAQLAEKVDLTLLNRMLRLVMDHNLADYISAKNNVAVSFKDMTSLNSVGLLKGLQFAGFLWQFAGLAADLCLLGLGRARELASPAASTTASPIKMYRRNFDKIHMVLAFEDADADNLVESFLGSAEGATPFDALQDYPNRRCWPRDCRFRKIRRDVNLGRAVFAELRQRLPASVAELQWDKSFVSVYSNENPNLLFSLGGFEVRICRASSGSPEAASSGGVWRLVHKESQEVTACAFLRVSEKSVREFDNKVRHILISAGASPYVKIVNKWNTAVIGLVGHYREAIGSTPELVSLLQKAETKIQNRIKLSINSKMPSRFPPVVFYAPKELGGLGMLSVGGGEDATIPNLLRYMASWESEIKESVRVWSEYSMRREAAIREKRKIVLEELEEIMDKGVPRINTLFQKDRHVLAYDKGWRVRAVMRSYSVNKDNGMYWTNFRHDGRLWNLDSYRTDIIEALGGVETILAHSLFKATGFTTWEGLFWEKASGFEESMRYRKLTNAQRQGLSQIPNRRFILWWSPTLNRANVYVGFQVQLDLTGIHMHGKIPALKLNYVQLFRAHLWQKLHESLVMDVCQALDQEVDTLGVELVQKEVIHPRKSYKLNSSCADIVLLAKDKWRLPNLKPSLLSDAAADESAVGGGGQMVSKFFVDIQLRWGDFDSHDIDRYARGKFLEYTSDGTSIYPSQSGVLLAVDLAYGTFGGYGVWLPGLKELLNKTMSKIMKNNPALFVLKERVRKGLQLYATEPPEPYLNSTNYAEIFTGNKNCWIVDDSNVYRVTVHKTANGNLSTKPVNGAISVFNPKTGQLFLKIVHASMWAGQKRLSQLAKWKTAEEVATLMRSLPSEEQPNQLIVMRKGILDPLEVHLLDFPNVVIKGSELQLPLHWLVRLDKIGDLIMKATESNMVLFNLFDDWLARISAYTAFSRLVLILRALTISADRARSILRPDRSVATLKNHLWPTLTDDQWIAAENSLKDLILVDFSKKNGVAISSLTQSEIRDIILGMETTISATAEAAKKIDEKTTNTSLLSMAPVITKVKNAQGEDVLVTSLSPYEQTVFKSRTDWRTRMAATQTLNIRLANVSVTSADLADSGQTTYVFPKNLLKRFVLCGDLRTSIGAFVFGANAKTSENVVEIRCLAFVPQLGTHEGVQMATGPCATPALDGLQPVGWISTSSIVSGTMTAALAKRHGSLVDNFGSWTPDAVALLVGFPPGSVELAGFGLTMEGLQWASEATDFASFSPETHVKQQQLILTDAFNGFTLTPPNGVFHYNFNQAKFSVDMPFHLNIQLPLPFYAPDHRATHFLAFTGDDGEAQE